MTAHADATGRSPYTALSTHDRALLSELEAARDARDEAEYRLLDAIRENGYQSPASEPQRVAHGRCEDRVERAYEAVFAAGLNPDDAIGIND